MLYEVITSREDIIRQCVQQGERIYDQLCQLSDSSKVKLAGHSSKIAMLKLDLPDEVDKIVAKTRISNKINEGVNQIVTAMHDEKTNNEISNRITSYNVCYTKLLRSAIMSRN